MTEFEQVPFDAAGFADNPEPRCPCLLLLDTSGSMQGRPISELNAGLIALKDELMADAVAAKRVEIGILTFGPIKIITDFTTADQFDPPTPVSYTHLTQRRGSASTPRRQDPLGRGRSRG